MHSVPQIGFAGKSLRQAARGLDFALKFSAKSGLIALLAPGLTGPLLSNIGLLVVIGVFLISGIYCFIEAMRLGQKYARRPEAQKMMHNFVFFNVLAQGLAWYLGLGALGFALFEWGPVLATGVPALGQIDQLVRGIGKSIAGVFVLIAGYIVAFEREGLKEGIDRIMLTVAAAPLLLPAVRVLSLVFSKLFPVFGDQSRYSPSMFLYMCLLLLVPIGFYIYAGTAPKKEHVPVVAYIRNLLWAPFVIGQKTRYDAKGFNCGEELLEEMIGQRARLGKRTFIPTRIWDLGAKMLGLRKEFDAIIVDVTTALRIIDKDKKKDNKKPYYTIMAGITKVKSVALQKETGPEEITSIMIPGPPHLCGCEKMEQVLWKELGFCTDKASLGYLPAHCMSDYFPHVVQAVLVPEPFATDIKKKVRQEGKRYNEFRVFEEYGLLLVRGDPTSDFAVSLVGDLVEGMREITAVKARITIGRGYAERLTKALDPGPGIRLEPMAALLALSGLETLGLKPGRNLMVIDPNAKEDEQAKANWNDVCRVAETLQQLNIAQIQETGLKFRCNSDIIRGKINDILAAKEV